MGLKRLAVRARFKNGTKLRIVARELLLAHTVTLVHIMGAPQAQARNLFYAHSQGASGEWESLSEHLKSVASRASEFASAFGAAPEAYNAGLLHDFGKYGELFQRRLRLPNLEKGIDHWSAGAWMSLNVLRGAAVPLAIQGHHIGLQHGSKIKLQKLWMNALSDPHLRISQPNDPALTVLKDRFASDGLEILPVDQSFCSNSHFSVASMLDVRMLFSALVDADFLGTELHFEGTSRPPAIPLNSDDGLKYLESFISAKAKNFSGSSTVQAMRHQLRQLCRAAADSIVGLYSLTAPTGSGKTLAMLEFALRHARKWGLRRIVMVAPYLTIIDQTADQWRAALQVSKTDHQSLLEHHSVAVPVNSADDETRIHDRLAENWDAPVIVTTTVQMLESLFANSPSACRKLHRLANSVVIFDEVQTLPLPLAVPTIAALAWLSKRYNTTVVFSTATQPAFESLSKEIQARSFCDTTWIPNELNSAADEMFANSHRFRYIWPESDETLTWNDLAQRLMRGSQPRRHLCIVNLKRHASELFDEIGKVTRNGVFHLSTAMCPQHRRHILTEIETHLRSREDCIVAATQCVEAGVDLDFPSVFRAIGPLEAIAQAAGRCNRNGTLQNDEATVRIFRPAENRFPDRSYESAARLAERFSGRDINSPATFAEYFRELYLIRGSDQIDSELYDAIAEMDFVTVARKYRIIPGGFVNVIVPYKQGVELAREVRNEWLSRDWIRRASAFSVIIRLDEYRRTPELFEPVRLKSGEDAPDWFLLVGDKYYHRDTGLQLPEKGPGFSVA